MGSADRHELRAFLERYRDAVRSGMDWYFGFQKAWNRESHIGILDRWGDVFKAAARHGFDPSTPFGDWAESQSDLADTLGRCAEEV